MKFTIQFQSFSKARQQWLTSILVVKPLKFWTLLSYIPHIIAWISPYTNAGKHRVVLTQGLVDISVANGQERTLLPTPQEERTIGRK